MSRQIVNMAPTFAKAVFLLSLVTPTIAYPNIPHHLDLRTTIVLANLTSNTTVLPGKWTYMGCVVDIGRTISSASYSNDTTMSAESCVTFCDAGNFLYAGTENSQDCFCGGSMPNQASKVSSTNCSMPCSGNSNEACGGSTGRMSLYYSAAAKNPDPVFNPGPANWTSVGCYGDSPQGRTLSEYDHIVEGAVNMTVARCARDCYSRGFVYAGLEYGQECWCDNIISGTGAKVNLNDCNTRCSGNSSEYCGASSRMQVYELISYLATVVTSSTTSTSSMTLSSGSAAKSVSISTSSPAGSTTSSPIPSSSTPASSTKSSSSSSATSPSKSATSQIAVSSSASSSTSSSIFAAVSTLPPTGTSANIAILVSTSTSSSPSASTMKTISGSSSISPLATSTSSSSPSTVTSISSTLSSASSGPSSTPSAFSSMRPMETSKSSAAEMSRSSTFFSSNNFVHMSTTSPSKPSTVLVSSIPAMSSGTAQWYSLGCYIDQFNRTLQFGEYSQVPGGAHNMTNDGCKATCERLGFTIAGTEYGQECWCGNELRYGGGPAVDGCTGCSMPCFGNSSEVCGGLYRLNAFAYGIPPAANPAVCPTTIPASMVSTKTATSTRISASSTAPSVPTPSHLLSYGSYNYLGCYTEISNARALSSATLLNYTGMTVEMCGAYCTPKYAYFGLEWSGECYCGDVLDHRSVPVEVTDCSMTCDGNKLEYCGSSNRIDLYHTNQTIPYSSTTSSMRTSPISTITISPTVSSSSTIKTTSIFSISLSSSTKSSFSLTTKSSSSTISTSTSSSKTVSSATATSTRLGTATNLPAGWKYSGCYNDTLAARSFNHQNPDNSALTNENCIASCISQNYTVAGMEYGSQCFCSNALYNNAALVAESDCSMPCGGARDEKCGAGNRLSVYYTGALSIYGPPAPTKSVGNWSYQGCYSDNVNGLNSHVLKWQIINSKSNSASTCLDQCAKFGYMSGGMEYGEECYCGDGSAMLSLGSTKVAESRCSQVCSGDATQICGGGNVMSYYTWTGKPLHTWANATGVAAGEYAFLIGGVIVPLITTLGINNKVTFLEKYGTGQVNSSTGAYELDLTLIDDVSKAWRPMEGIKTDIFCSAGLTLPDKAGRQINVGGWSGGSTFGIRFYYPDGSAGVWGKNGWQENYSEVHLQAGRWYPSAMIMANGSILVVGGEDGSNGKPTPSLEVLPLPKGGSALYMEWLEKSDPNNLYPFLFVLPSGGIFVGYWNEARILDERTFATTKLLPSIPGSVVNPLAGRTYPLEGSAMLLPQYAPYTDPLTVLICGGSEMGEGRAIDNCVSTQPEVANPVWTIERMPSQRVMSNMVALPDGTYLILNGAMQGVAGFGFAINPNMQAVLYDPSKPLHARMTIMHSTSVARLYHSEAILLHDGRVMVSGSDPEDVRFPEEYRVEQFLPPYLLSGAVQPSYTMSNKDWSYGQAITIQVTLPARGPVRVSILGAVSSTHGNSMGQRTLFPSVSCAGNTCTIIAPPNAHVCPPGWFQVFILDGPTPSHSQWVRIGGDPGNLGAWPPQSDFTKPGFG